MSVVAPTDEAAVVKFYCPACKRGHKVWLGANGWEYNGNASAPTFWPSIKVESADELGPTICHSFVINGQIEYLADCTHAMRGQRRVQLEPWPEGAL